VDLHGVCRNGNGDPLQRIWVRVYAGRSRIEKIVNVANAATDDAGSFHISATLPDILRSESIRPLGFVAVFSDHGGHAVAMRSWKGEAIDDGLEVVLAQKHAKLSGQVTDQDGRPVQGASLFLPNALNTDLPASHNGLTDGEGRFEIIGLPVAKKTDGFVCVFHPNYGQKKVLYSSVPSDIEIVLETPGTLTGRVIDETSQQPQSECVVTARMNKHGGFAEAKTDSAGRYELRAAPGDYILTATRHVRIAESSSTFQVRSAETTEVAPLLLKASDKADGLFSRSDSGQRSPAHIKDPGPAVGKPIELPLQSRKMSSAEATAAVNELLAKLKQQQQEEHLAGKDEWALTMKSLIELGPDAIPALSLALDQMAQDDRMMLRSIPFVLRGIGDKRAVPALIRAIPRCFGRDGSDMGYRCTDPELSKFMQTHDSDDNHDPSRGPERGYSYGRPVNELFRTLQKFTGRKDRLRQLHFVSYRESNPRGNVLGQRLYNQTAVAWAKFWEENWSRFTSVEAFAKVDVQLVPEGKLPNPVSRVTALVKNSGQGNGSVGSVFSAEGTRCFRDLDTGLVGDLPERFLKLTREQRMARMGEIVA
jgi:hypothetical protein